MFISQQKTGDTCKSKAIDQTTSFQGSSSKKKKTHCFLFDLGI